MRWPRIRLQIGLLKQMSRRRSLDQAPQLICLCDSRCDESTIAPLCVSSGHPVPRSQMVDRCIGIHDMRRECIRPCDRVGENAIAADHVHVALLHYAHGPAKHGGRSDRGHGRVIYIAHRGCIIATHEILGCLIPGKRLDNLLSIQSAVDCAATA